MGNLMLNDISYSGNGTGVLMLNGINYTGGQGGGEVVIVPIPVTSQMVSASSTVGSNFEGYRAFDGQSCNISTLQGGWLAGASDNTPTLTVNFGEAKKLGRISIETANNNNPDTTRAVYIEGSNDGSTWENILASGSTVSLLFEVGKYNEYSFNLNEGEYQYFRIRGTQPFFGGSFQYACSFSEITIYDKSSGGGGVNTTIGTFFNFTPNANTTPTGVMLFKNGNTMYCVYTCNNDEFYYDTANSKIVRTGFYYADTMPSAIPANYSNFLFQNGGDITGVAQANLGNYFIHSTYDIKDENGNVLIPKDVNIEDFGF